MPLTNSSQRYGAVTKSFHWLTAFLILTAIPLGMIASNMPIGTDAEITRTVWFFSLHKTVGVTAFFVALARIFWALGQPKPTSLQEDGWEPALAEIVHWLLYFSILFVPLSGWLHHAALDGFAPIWWPFGQSMPFVPKSAAVAEFFGAWHFVLTKVLAISIFLHIAGAMKHHFLDKDSTLRRMLPGQPHLPDINVHSGGRKGLIGALVIYLFALGGGSALGLQTHNSGTGKTLSQVQSGWQVKSGSLGIRFKQFGSEVSGDFSDWTAAIQYDETNQTGDITVTIDIASLDIGGVTKNAMEAEYFDATAFPTATYQAQIKPADSGLVAEGTLTLRGVTIPLVLPFDLTIQDGVAVAKGSTQTDRRDYKIGESQTSEDNLDFIIAIEMELKAQKNE